MAAVFETASGLLTTEAAHQRSTDSSVQPNTTTTSVSPAFRVRVDCAIAPTLRQHSHHPRSHHPLDGDGADWGHRGEPLSWAETVSGWTPESTSRRTT